MGKDLQNPRRRVLREQRDFLQRWVCVSGEKCFGAMCGSMAQACSAQGVTEDLGVKKPLVVHGYLLWCEAHFRTHGVPWRGASPSPHAQEYWRIIFFVCLWETIQGLLFYAPSYSGDEDVTWDASPFLPKGCWEMKVNSFQILYVKKDRQTDRRKERTFHFLPKRRQIKQRGLSSAGPWSFLLIFTNWWKSLQIPSQIKPLPKSRLR